jgi:hypothetical protein
VRFIEKKKKIATGRETIHGEQRHEDIKKRRYRTIKGIEFKVNCDKSTEVQ